jgi:hypothetical protein
MRTGIVNDLARIGFSDINAVTIGGGAELAIVGHGGCGSKARRTRVPRHCEQKPRCC